MINFAAVMTAVEAHTNVIRLVVADAKGSTPRDTGTSMLIWETGHDGTIGGGKLEFDAIKAAQLMLEQGRDAKVDRLSLGPHLGQCCGGAVTLVFERFDANVLAHLRTGTSTHHTRRIDTGPTDMPKSLKTYIEQAQAAAQPPALKLTEGWLTEPTSHPRLPVYIYGAGHVGRALAVCLAPLPQFEVHLSDVREDQFDDLPNTIWQSWELLPTDVMAHAPDTAAHFIMTPEHDYDLELCHRLLGRKFGSAGLIGSATKWARFQSRLAALGHAAPQVNRIQCPIGDTSLGKHPQAIAIGVVGTLLRHQMLQRHSQRSTA